MKIVRAGEEHIPAIVEFWKQLGDFQSGFDPVHRLREDAHVGFAQYVREKLVSEEDLFLVAVIRKKVVGFSISAVVKKRPDVFERASVVEVSDMLVLEEYRRQGVGGEMLDHIRRWVKSKGIGRIELHAEARNVVGLAFWRKHGFADFILRLYADV